jgi:glutamine amidotransferase
MTRLFGSVCNQPQNLTTVLHPVRQALATKTPVLRWGLGFVQWGEVCLKQSPRGSESGVDFYEILRGIPTDYVVGAVSSDDGLKGNLNTQPFRFRRWLFAMEGSLPEEGELLPKLAEQVPDYLRRNIQGKTAGEVIFHLLLSKLHDLGKIDDLHLETKSFQSAIGETWRVLDATVGSAAESLGNMICTNSRSLCAVRRAGPLFSCRIKQVTDPRLPESEARAALVVSADTNPGAGFEEIPAGKGVIVHRDVSIEMFDTSL